MNFLKQKRWAQAGTHFHNEAAAVGDAMKVQSGLPKGFSFEFEKTVKSGKGGSRLDILVEGPVETMIYDWKTTGKSALKSEEQAVKHKSQLTKYLQDNNINKTVTMHESMSWVDF